MHLQSLLSQVFCTRQLPKISDLEKSLLRSQHQLFTEGVSLRVLPTHLMLIQLRICWETKKLLEEEAKLPAPIPTGKPQQKPISEIVTEGMSTGEVNSLVMPEFANPRQPPKVCPRLLARIEEAKSNIGDMKELFGVLDRNYRRHFLAHNELKGHAIVIQYDYAQGLLAYVSVKHNPTYGSGVPSITLSICGESPEADTQESEPTTCRRRVSV